MVFTYKMGAWVGSGREVDERGSHQIGGAQSNRSIRSRVSDSNTIEETIFNAITEVFSQNGHKQSITLIHKFRPYWSKT